MGHSKASCTTGNALNLYNCDDVYGPWLRAEPDAYTIVNELYGLRRVKIPRGDIFDTFSKEINMDVKNGEDDPAMETTESSREGDALTHNQTWGEAPGSNLPTPEGHVDFVCVPTENCQTHQPSSDAPQGVVFRKLH